jgi:hypothetical protein
MPDDANIVYDDNGHPRHVSYSGGISVTGATPQEVAQNFLREQATALQIPQNAMDSLHVSAAIAPISEDQSLRFESEKRLMDSTVVSYAQTMFGLPIYQAGVSVVMNRPNNSVRAATSTLHYDITAQPPSPGLTANAADAATTGGYDDLVRKAIPAAQGMRINRTRLMVYRYDASKRTHVHGAPGDQRGFGPEPPTLPLPKVPESIKDGQHYIVVEALFSFPLPKWDMLNWQAFIEPDTAAVLFLRALVDGAMGLVFDRDPITKTGNMANLPRAASATLDLVRDNVALADLGPVSAGRQSLVGTFIQLTNSVAPHTAPTEASPFNFAYVSRTDNFAATNAYYHCCRFFRLVRDTGFDIPSYFDGTAFPVPVDHRAPALGNDVNAQCRGNALNNGIGSLWFALADDTNVANPIGIAADWRVVLHELSGHGILWDHVDSPNFGFSHSAGDSIAVILNDPDTLAPDRFVSFPWVDIGRRHDRTPADGWGWGGNIAAHPFNFALDRGGYNNEQILSSTHFRLYRSIGGDSADQARRDFAAHSTVYLILRAVGQLTPSTNPPNALAWEQQLESADAGAWLRANPVETHAGGAYQKVIRWAFEKQGLFRAPGTLPTAEGAPPDVDVYIDDGRHGEYAFQPNHGSCPDIWNRVTVGEGGGVHEEPIIGQVNFAYVRVKNRGTQMATNVVVKGFHCRAGAGRVYPSDWIAMSTSQLNAPNVAASDNVGVVVGPFNWTPSNAADESILFSVSAMGDASNIDGRITGAIPDWRLVPHDNNLGQRNVRPVHAVA